MKIKRFVAADMRQAMRLVREEQGPEAVILSTRRLADGIEVIAAIDYDESLINQAVRQGAAPAASETDPLRMAEPASAGEQPLPRPVAAAPASLSSRVVSNPDSTDAADHRARRAGNRADARGAGQHARDAGDAAVEPGVE